MWGFFLITRRCGKTFRYYDFVPLVEGAVAKK